MASTEQESQGLGYAAGLISSAAQMGFASDIPEEERWKILEARVDKLSVLLPSMADDLQFKLSAVPSAEELEEHFPSTVIKDGEQQRNPLTVERGVLLGVAQRGPRAHIAVQTPWGLRKLLPHDEAVKLWEEHRYNRDAQPFKSRRKTDPPLPEGVSILREQNGIRPCYLPDLDSGRGALLLQRTREFSGSPVILWVNTGHTFVDKDGQTQYARQLRWIRKWDVARDDALRVAIKDGDPERLPEDTASNLRKPGTEAPQAPAQSVTPDASTPTAAAKRLRDWQKKQPDIEMSTVFTAMRQEGYTPHTLTNEQCDKLINILTTPAPSAAAEDEWAEWE